MFVGPKVSRSGAVVTSDAGSAARQIVQRSRETRKREVRKDEGGRMKLSLILVSGVKAHF
jgi:hypothetical protein